MRGKGSLNRVCLTPTRNESWIIEHFLAATKLWADHIIVADQGSSDGTLEQLQRTPGVDVLVNNSPTFDERDRQRLLIEGARRIGGKRILIALDADEMLSANCVRSAEWQRIDTAPPGTILRFRWVNILPGYKTAWIPQEPLVCGFVDDGSSHVERRRIHNPRVPSHANAPVIDLDEIVVLHLQYIAWSRMLSKQRWYQVLEYATLEEKRPLDIFRQYHHMNGSWDKDEICPVDPAWLRGYDLAAIADGSQKDDPITWWDREVVELLRKRGPKYFSKLAIWNRDWNAVARRLALKDNDLADPRSAFERIAHAILAATQNHRSNYGVRAFERFLRLAGW